MLLPSITPGFGKRKIRRETLGSVPAGANEPSPLLYLHDNLSSRNFLVDTGAAISVLPYSSTAPCSNLSLVSADGSAIKSWDKRTLPLKFGNRRFSWSFRLAAVDRPIIGFDFLEAHNLLVDVRNRRLIDAQSHKSLNASPSATKDSIRTVLLPVLITRVS